MFAAVSILYCWILHVSILAMMMMMMCIGLASFVGLFRNVYRIWASHCQWNSAHLQQTVSEFDAANVFCVHVHKGYDEADELSLNWSKRSARDPSNDTNSMNAANEEYYPKFALNARFYRKSNASGIDFAKHFVR